VIAAQLRGSDDQRPMRDCFSSRATRAPRSHAPHDRRGPRGLLPGVTGRIVGDSHVRPCRSAIALGHFTVSQYGCVFDHHDSF
jgi:hypothetical protein